MPNKTHIETGSIFKIETENIHLKTHRFLLGDKPCLGDFGLMGPLKAHLALDPIPGKIMKVKSPFVYEWIE